ncbi:hypothetical protein [Salinimicrobium marinum]|uniref:hypothetical protein n=1 Tax=Salinimicrobium marinum TaxID=680283 RepID=UPI00167A8B37|nr:hypothetical protein [Salinimicrobium marinum]
MKDLIEYLEILLLLSPLLLFIIAMAFRLLDNSGYLFLQKEILINSSYVSVNILREQIQRTKDSRFRKRLKKVLVYRKLHRLFLLMIIPAFPVTIFTYFFLF